MDHKYPNNGQCLTSARRGSEVGQASDPRIWQIASGTHHRPTPRTQRPARAPAHIIHSSACDMDLQEVTFSCVMRRNGGAPAQEFIPTPGAGDLPSGKFNARRHARAEGSRTRAVCGELG